jgi:hypothetical protein
MTKLNAQGIKDNLQHIAGIVIGLTALRLTGLRFGKESRGTKWFSTVAANLAADGDVLKLFPYVVFY